MRSVPAFVISMSERCVLLTEVGVHGVGDDWLGVGGYDLENEAFNRIKNIAAACDFV